MTDYALRLANGQDTAPRTRQGDSLGLWQAGPLNARSGLRPDGGGVVTAVAGSMAVQVTPFSAWVNGGTSDAQGGYPFVNDATKVLTIADGHASLSRTDTVAVVIRENAYDGSGFTDATLQVVAGTPGAGAPTLPATALPLRNIVIPAGLSAGSGGMGSSNISTDRRQWLSATGGILPVASLTERDALGAQNGQAVFRLDTNAVEVKTTTGWKAVPFSAATGPAEAAGVATVDITAVNTPGTVAITFPTGRFSAPPVISVMPVGSASATAIRWTASIPTSTGFTITAERSVGSADIVVHWTAREAG